MTVLLDSNVLLRLVQPLHPFHRSAQAAIGTLRARGESLYIVPQTIYEFWVVATRPLAANGLGMPVPASQAEAARLKRMFSLLPDSVSLFVEWERVVFSHHVIGRQAHDARLVAAMRTHGLTKLLTFNGDDFRRFPDVIVLDPAAL